MFFVSFYRSFFAPRATDTSTSSVVELLAAPTPDLVSMSEAHKAAPTVDVTRIQLQPPPNHVQENKIETTGTKFNTVAMVPKL